MFSLINENISICFVENDALSAQADLGIHRAHRHMDHFRAAHHLYSTVLCAEV